MWENKPKIAVDPASIGQSSLSFRFGASLFCRALAFMGARLVAHGVTVIFDATANRRAYRDFARSLVPNFIEVAVECPLELCMQRDYKGMYLCGRRGETSTVPGLQDPYEPPLNPEVTIDTIKVKADEAAEMILKLVKGKFSCILKAEKD